MDIVSHGLYGGVAFGRKNRKDFWLSFFFGIAPDLFSFGIFTIGTWIGIFDRPDWSRGQHPDPAMIPQFVSTFYDYTHSLVIFALVFGLVWLIRRRPWWIMAGWGLHILVDIPTHSSAFFPTRFSSRSLTSTSMVTRGAVPRFFSQTSFSSSCFTPGSML
jgi:hypothetical protein